MNDFLMFLTVGLWLVAILACLVLIRYNGRRIWQYGGTRFLDETDGGARITTVPHFQRHSSI